MTLTKPHSCCDDNDHDCLQSRDCPIYKAKCRQRAGKPADYNNPVWVAKTNAELEAELERQWRRDLKSIVFIASCIVSFAVIVLVAA
jgi:hypothetical protein